MMSVRACVVSLVGLVAGVGCKTQRAAGPPTGAPGAALGAVAAAARPFALHAGPEARAARAFEALVAPPAHMAARLDALAQRIGLPLPLGEALLSSLVGGGPLKGAPLSREQLGRLDAKTPVAVVGLARRPGAGAGTDGSDEVPYDVCMALTFTDVSVARRTLDELAPVAADEGGAQLRRPREADPLWTTTAGRTALLALDRGALSSCGALALEALRAQPQGLATVTLFPHAMAKGSGTDLSTFVEQSAVLIGQQMAVAAAAPGEASAAPRRRSGAAAGSTSSAPIGPGMALFVVAIWKRLGQLLVESDAVRFSLDAGPELGLALHAALAPKPGTPLAARTARVTPWRLAPGLDVADDRGFVAAFGGGRELWSAWGDVVSASGPAGARLRAALDEVMALQTGEGSCVGSIAGGLASTCAYSLVPDATAPQLFARMEALFRTYDVWQKEVFGRTLGRIALSRAKETFVVKQTLVAATPQERRLQRALFGGALEYAFAVRGGQVVMSMGRDARKRLTRGPRMQPASAAPPVDPARAPIVAAALEAARGADMVVIVDPISVALETAKSVSSSSREGQGAAMLGQLGGVAELRAPFVFTARSGGAASYGLDLPIGTLANVAKVVAPFLGLLGGPAGPAPQ